jgi:hypothetical protein
MATSWRRARVRRRAIEDGDPAPRRHERVLDDIVGVAAIADQPDGDAQQARGVLAHQLLVRRVVATRQPLDEVALGVHARQYHAAVSCFRDAGEPTCDSQPAPVDSCHNARSADLQRA